VHLVDFEEPLDHQAEEDYMAEHNEPATEKVCYDQAAHLPGQASNLERLKFGVEWSQRMAFERSAQQTSADLQMQDGDGGQA
jgi:hypothetical protein